MTAVTKALTGLLGLGGAPKVDTSAATSKTAAAQSDANAVRASLFETAGGAGGSTLSPQQIAASRPTIFGN